MTPRRGARFLLPLALCAWAVLLPGSTADGAAGTVELPTEIDALAFAPNSETILFGQLGIETRLPGPVDDEEQVVVSLSTDGSIGRVQVTQRLSLSGTGDFSFKVPGPARTVEVLADSGEQPGLRKGALLWQGFSSGQKLLGARVDLFPGEEAHRLPIRFSLRMTVGGRSLEPEATASGPFELTLGIENNSAVPIEVTDAPADPEAVAPLLDEIRKALAGHRRPIPGQRGIATSVRVEGQTTGKTKMIEVPFRVEGELRFPIGSMTDVRVDGGETATDARSTVVRFHTQVGGGSTDPFRLRVTGVARGLGLPSLEMTGGPALPLARLLRPPVGRSWARAVALAPSRVDGRRMVGLAMEVLWQVARLRQFDAYLGNPDIDGSSTSSYTFRLAPVVRVALVPPAGPVRARPVTIVVAVLLLALILLGLAMAWAHS
jgi:hypothetical protein